MSKGLEGKQASELVNALMQGKHDEAWRLVKARSGIWTQAEVAKAVSECEAIAHQFEVAWNFEGAFNAIEIAIALGSPHSTQLKSHLWDLRLFLVSHLLGERRFDKAEDLLRSLAPGLEQEDCAALGRVLAAFAHEHELALDIEPAIAALDLARSLDNDDQAALAERIAALRGAHVAQLLRQGSFDSASTFLEQAAPQMGSRERNACSNVLAVFAHEHEVANDFEAAIIALRLASSLECDEVEAIKTHVGALTGAHLVHLLEEEAFSDASEFLASIEGELSPEARTACAKVVRVFAHKREVELDFPAACGALRLAQPLTPGQAKDIDRHIAALKDAHLALLLEAGDHKRAQEMAGIRGAQLLFYETTSVKDYCARSGDDYREILPERAIASPDLRFLEGPVRLDSTPGTLIAPPQYFALLASSVAYRGANVVLSDSSAIYDLAAHDRAREAVIPDGGLGEWRSVRSIKGGAVFIEQRSCEPVEIPTGLQMFGAQSANYGHWFCEFMPRMLVFDSPNTPSDIPIFVDPDMPANHVEALRLLNSANRPILTMPEGPVRFGKLGVAPVPAYFPVDVKKGNEAYDTIWPADIFSALRGKIFASLAQAGHRTGDKPRRLFISRRDFGSRRLLNEEEIVSALAQFGFEVVHPEKLSFVEQVELFSSAEIVIGSCSSALTNCLFCKPGAVVIGMIHSEPSFNFRGYTSFINAGGADVVFVQGASDIRDEVHPFHRDYTIDVGKVVSALKDIIRQGRSVGSLPPTLVFSSAEWDAVEAIFDPDYVRRRHPQIPETVSLDDYRTSSGAAFDPNPLFDTKFYLSQLAEPLDNNLAPLDHYALIGAKAGLKPSPLFDPDYYGASNLALSKAARNPLADYLERGLAAAELALDLDRPEVRDSIVAAFRCDPDNPFALGWYVGLTLLEGRHQDVPELLARARGWKTTHVLDVALAIVLRNVDLPGRWHAAVPAYRALLAGRRADPTYHGRLAAILRGWGFLEEAEQELRRIADDDSGSMHPDLEQMLVSLAVDREQFEGLLNEAREAALASPDRAAAIRARADHARPVDSHQASIEALLSFGPSSLVTGPAGPSSPVRRTEHPDSGLLILDTSFPADVSSFRYGEFVHLLKCFANSKLYSSIWDISRFVPGKTFLDLHDEFAAKRPPLAARIGSVHHARDMDARLIYTVFLNNAVGLWKTNPLCGSGSFVFTLYPGGGFDPGSTDSDSKLRLVLDDHRTKQVITTQLFTYDYLLSNKLCEPDRITHIFGGLIPSCLEPMPTDRSARRSGPMNVCFVAQRYTERGIEKGCDVFTSMVRKLRGERDLVFHFVGGWTPENVGLRPGPNIIFHGVQPGWFFPPFYRQMDVIVSPNISHFELNNGRGPFDGFPTTTCVEAAVEGAAMFISDSLKCNRRLDGSPIFVEGTDFELITRDVDALAELLLHYRDRPEALRRIGDNGRAAVLREFSFERQMQPRIELLKRELHESPGS